MMSAVLGQHGDFARQPRNHKASGGTTKDGSAASEAQARRRNPGVQAQAP